MKTKDKIRIDARFDRKLAWRGGGSRRYLVVEVVAPPDEAAVARPPRPINVALVIDASASMGGPRLAAAKRAAVGIIEALKPRDLLSVVSFSSDVQTHVHCRHCDAERKTMAEALVGALEVRSNTNLAAGWLRGAECAAEGVARAEDARNRVILLTDGEANQGILDPAELARYSEALRERGICSSAVGIGDSYSPRQIQAIADFGGGQMHDAERPEEIVEVVMGELLDISRTVVEDIRVALTLPVGVRAAVLGSYPAACEGREITASIGSLPGGAFRKVVFAITLPEGIDGEQLDFGVQVRWRETGAGAVRESEPLSPFLTYVRGSVNSAQPRDLEASRFIAEVWQAQVVRDLVELNRQGRYEPAADYATRQLKHFERYCRDLPGGDQLVEQMRRAAARIVEPMRERSRKEIELALYKRSYSSADYRSSRPPRLWDSYLDERS